MKQKVRANLVLLFAFCISGICVPAGSSPPDSAELERLLPVGKFDAELLVPRLSQECEALVARMTAATHKHRDWWIEAIRNAPAGQPIPYDSRLGLSALEYEKLLGCSDSMKMWKVGSGQIRVESAQRVLTLHASGVLKDLDGIQIDLKRDEVRTPLGTARDRSTRTREETADSPTGPWSGFQWKLEPSEESLGDLSELSGTLIRFCVGQRAGAGGMIYYNATVVESGVKTARVLMVIYYVLPAAGESRRD